MNLLHRCVLGAAILWVRSLRPRFVDSPPLPDSGILVLWHEDMLPCLAAFAHRDLRVLISQSKDGEFGARAAERLGYRPMRGSSSRGGVAALKGLAQDLKKDGGWVAVVADGPRGPRRASKPGAAWLGEIAGLPTWCVSAVSPRGFTLNSWDRCRIPLPFSRVRLRCSQALISGASDNLDAAMKENERRLREFLSLPSIV
jgi:lysophospholipid acyltransferase (LPLAT)-like uncharacterized protein